VPFLSQSFHSAAYEQTQVCQAEARFGGNIRSALFLKKDPLHDIAVLGRQLAHHFSKPARLQCFIELGVGPFRAVRQDHGVKVDGVFPGTAPVF